MANPDVLEKKAGVEQATSDDLDVNLIMPSGRILKLQNAAVVAAFEIDITSNVYEDGEVWGDDNERFQNSVEETAVE